ncbi:formylglycine-generating enzyme family protein [Mariniflexile litorale]|uniref:Formylglycine-generating enzyme family protein n=1 Tax=Mariniflexile litorale TaxID=3045158 RepID=A0AAU7EFM6_9FLAO|nr:formylglycine-generating enzyme family protein [Mariniflexile sp. KMM 9835]MDQ8211736.1 formylglycine-generating enzyme family protein [Mariniflexile sp. KMM 9835]
MRYRILLFPILLLAYSCSKTTDKTSSNLSPVAFGDTITISHLNMVMLPIPSGSITLKNTDFETSDEKLTQVSLSNFWLAKTEVTQAQYEKIMGNNPSYFKGANLPIEQVSWEDAMNFCHKLTDQEHAAGRIPIGYTYTLPAEAQWEYACRAGTTGDYAGNLDDMGWYVNNSEDKSHPVGLKKANAWGLYDMHGNIREWCLDWYGDYPGGSKTNYSGPASGTHRVSRGGNWHRGAEASTASKRSKETQGRCDDLNGFRIALSPIPEIKIVMVPIPEGTFTLRNTGNNKEKSLTEVTLSKFWLGETEITQAQYKSIMGIGSPHFQGPNLPMEHASWENAMDFCKKLNDIERAAGRLHDGYEYTLPTEAQWEYASLAGTSGDYTKEIDSMAWYKNNSERETHPVGTKKPNNWGLYDMQGNVRELCYDWYTESYPGGSVKDYKGPLSGNYRVLKGGSWADSAENCNPTNRGYRSEGRKGELLGFRIALSSIR